MRNFLRFAFLKLNGKSALWSVTILSIVDF
jgi:hypothetical protein